MRHVKAKPDALPDRASLEALIRAAYVDIKRSLEEERASPIGLASVPLPAKGKGSLIIKSNKTAAAKKKSSRK